MPHCFFIDSKVIYAAKPNLYANLGMTYTGDYRQKLRTFVVQLSAIFGF